MVHKLRFILISLILMSLVILTQCGKSTNPQEINDLIGQWQWVSSIGGFGGWTRTPETEGYNIVLEFDSDSTFISSKIDTAGTVITDGSYYTAYEEVWNLNDSGNVIYMDNFLRSAFEINNDTLFLDDICVDCFGHIYVRIE